MGARVWCLVQQPRSVAEILDVLVQEYEIEPQRCEQDLLQLLDQALTAGLIEVKEVPG
jgi:hypothetical protein